MMTPGKRFGDANVKCHIKSSATTLSKFIYSIENKTHRESKDPANVCVNICDSLAMHHCTIQMQ